MTWTLSKLSISGVKGVLNRSGDFKLSPKDGKPRSIAVFGRNGHGKSGYADAIEYLFSADGEVEHLGKGAADSEQGGKHAIPHVLAAESGVLSQITAEFQNLATLQRLKVVRPVVTGRKDTRPLEIESVIANAPAHRVLRQHDLRRFVVDMSPGQKFQEFARWIGWDSAAKLLGHLTTTENSLHDSGVDREIQERLRSVELNTNGVVRTFDFHAILTYCSEEAGRQTGVILPVSSIEDIEMLIRALQERRVVSLRDSDAASAFGTMGKLNSIAAKLSGDEGLINRVRIAVQKAVDAETVQRRAQATARDAIFREVWTSARSVLDTAKPDVCPVCKTPWHDTARGSREKVLFELSGSLSNLEELSAADESLRRCVSTLRIDLQQIWSDLELISDYASALSLRDLRTQSDAVRADCRELVEQFRPEASVEARRDDLDALLKHVAELATKQVDDATHGLEIPGTPQVVIDIDGMVRRLQSIRENTKRLGELSALQSSVRAIERQFGAVAAAIREEVKTSAETAVGALRGEVSAIYRKIHTGEAVPNVFVDLNAEDKTLTIRVNFHSDERKVPPGGYLSEAQINTLGLALFLSSVRLFNTAFPFVVLDDIVSSYDADCRARIVDVLAENMAGFQIFLTTHDERFYAHLKQRLDSDNWIFEKISSYDFASGPKRESDNLRPSQIADLINGGDPRIAGNAVRQYMEEWLDKMCEIYEVHTIHRRGSRDYQRTLFDLWQPFCERACKLGSGFGAHVSSSQPYQRLKGTPIINYYSHFQANPYEWSAIGDVSYLWAEFGLYVNLFACNSCKKLLRFDSDDNRVYCTCGKSILP